MTKIEQTGCQHERFKPTCIWCKARKDHPDVSRIVVNRHDGYAFALVNGVNLMYEEDDSHEWRRCRANMSNAT